MHQYIMDKKMSEASYYLSETTLDVKEIAQKLGFSDSHNFMKVYKKETGMTPSEYRNSFPNRLNYDS
ncbi:helix-turn-helix domain-containing protein [Hungatella sp.]|uniref:helix-turn-helix domain-containing protein n=1 Tax=Hungatella TaxID=1649459 RepID=UPI00399619EE